MDGRDAAIGFPYWRPVPPVSNRSRQAQPPHDKELRETTKWFYTRHSLDVKCIRGKYDEIRDFVYQEFRTFASFDDPIKNLATVEVDVPNGVAYFDLKDWMGDLSDFPIIGNDDKVEVRLRSNGSDEVTGTTAGRHQLVGIRKWRVQQLSEKPLDVNLMTHAYEHERGWVNFVGGYLARGDQKLIWETYLKNIAGKVKDRFGGEVGEKVRTQGPTPTGPMSNPFLEDVR